MQAEGSGSGGSADDEDWAPSLGGTPSIRTASSTGGASIAIGTVSTVATNTHACTENTNLLESLDSVTGNWLGADPASLEDNPCGVQGTIQAFSDEVPTATSPSPIDASPCAEGRCCIGGALSYWTALGGDGVTPAYSEWGAGLKLSLNADGAAIRRAYGGPARGFKIATAGTIPAGDVIRYQVVRNLDESMAAPFVEFAALGEHSVVFADAECLDPGMVEQGCTTTGGPFELRLLLAGGETAGPFNLCITGITPIL
jgi:hypothetical protein